MSTPSVNARSHLAHLASRPTDGPYPNLTPPPSMVHCQVGSQYLLTPEKRDGRSHGQEGTERYTVSSPSQPKQDEQDPKQTTEQNAHEDSHNHVPVQHRPHKKCHLHIPQPHASRPDECQEKQEHRRTGRPDQELPPDPYTHVRAHETK